ncbi:Armadillo-type fold [Pseudocohnilembus persalinus]|uniref:Armadillo-type fold n=1 Tax=Pseudocohnilembus persalinus TaxID=266149 RepID=A0A0V0R8E4_PSEPJ|nr:Armadillo-type fold [Pseudocohnilembus persalinus]|eukprot:KRX10734.1 Armadillo-type fold [Pseudocohnilembus persalinus]
MSLPPQNYRDQNGGNYFNQYQVNQKQFQNGMNQNFPQYQQQPNMTFQDIQNYQNRQNIPHQQNWQYSQGQENLRVNQQPMYSGNYKLDNEYQQQAPHILLGTPNMQPNVFSQDTGIQQYAHYYQQDDQQNGHQSKIDPEIQEINDLVLLLRQQDKRDEALAELYKKRECAQLAPILWHSFGTISILLQEILNIYPYLCPPSLAPNMSIKICNVLCLFQNLALHQETRQHFLKASLYTYLLPLLNTNANSKFFENLRVTSLGVVGALVKGEDSNAIKELIKSDIIVYCLKIMKNSQDLQRTVATFIFQRILLDNDGLAHILSQQDRFFAVIKVLSEIIKEIIEQDPEKRELRLVRLILRCCLRLSKDQKYQYNLNILYLFTNLLFIFTFQRPVGFIEVFTLRIPKCLRTINKRPNNIGMAIGVNYVTQHIILEMNGLKKQKKLEKQKRLETINQLQTVEQLNQILNQNNCLQEFIASEIRKENQKEKKNCPICMLDIDKSQKIKHLPCIHSFHKQCINVWLNKNPVCPVCKLKVDTY